MKTTYKKIYSKKLEIDFELKIYGYAGKSVIVFPSSCGRFFDFEDRGMISSLAPFIDNGDIQVICVDSRDSQSWFSDVKDHFMGIHHRNYELCITTEIIPWLRENFKTTQKLITVGVSWGGYHALNFAFKFPNLFDAALSLSGAYSLRSVIGDYYDEHVYYNDILRYMPNLHTPDWVGPLQQSFFFIIHGKGNWERCNHDAWELAQILGKEQIPHHYSVWSEEYPHDWNAWLRQLPFYFDLMKKGIDYNNHKINIIK